MTLLQLKYLHSEVMDIREDTAALLASCPICQSDCIVCGLVNRDVVGFGKLLLALHTAQTASIEFHQSPKLLLLLHQIHTYSNKNMKQAYHFQTIPSYDIISIDFPSSIQDRALNYKSRFVIQESYNFRQISMSSNYSQADLRKKLYKQKINETTLYYCLVKKQGKNISFIKNDRLLIYDDNRKILFYNNDYKNLPYIKTIPEPKNDVSTSLQNATFKIPENTSQIQVKSMNKNSKGEMETVQWNFICQTQQLAKEWAALFEQENNKRIYQLTGQKNAGFIQDTLNELVRSKHDSPKKQTILKTEQQILKPKPLQQQQQNIKNSNISIQRQKSRISIKQSQASQIPPLRNTNNGLQSRKILEGSRNPRLNNTESQIYMKQEQNNISKEESRISIKQSKIKESEDWNMKFLRNFNEMTLIEFQKAALSAFRSIWEQDKSRIKQKRRQYETGSLIVNISNSYTEEAKFLKRQFRNYHFILQSCKKKLVIGVPLTCLIELQGVVALVKAPIPSSCKPIKLQKLLAEIKQLQRYTRISNLVLDKALLYDTTDVYGMNSERIMIFVDGLIEYLPIHTDQQYLKASLRPQYILQNINQIVPGGEIKSSNRNEYKVLTNICDGVEKCVKQLSIYLSNQQQFWVDALELKEIFHYYGVNFKYLPKVYAQVTNKHVKKYIQSVMAAKVAKQMITDFIKKDRISKQQMPAAKIVQDSIAKLLEGNNSTSNQLWKELSLRAKKLYGSPLNNNQILGGFFLNSIIKLMRVQYDITKLNKGRKIFKQQGIIAPGFVLSLIPKSKIYNRFISDFIEQIRYACKQQRKDEELYDQIVKEFGLMQNPLPLQYSTGINYESIAQYLSYYTPPKTFDSNNPLKHINLYQDSFKEAPNSFTLKMTKAYLDWCIKKQKIEQFKKGIQNALKIADFWLQENHLFHCQLYQLLSDFYAGLGNGQESINFMKQSLSKCIRVSGNQSKLAGTKYYELGERELKVGHKKEALDNFMKAKANMQSNQNQTLKYPQLLMRLASLQLNSGNIEGCIQGSLQAIKTFEQYDRKDENNYLHTEIFKVKTFQVLSRAYQICGKKEEMRKMANMCSKTFNRCTSEWAFQQMIRICLAAVIFGSSQEKCSLFLQFLNKKLQENRLDEEQALGQLKNLAQSMNVMQKFMSKFQQIDKVIAQGGSKRGYSQQSNDFVFISCRIAGCVGQDYIQGLVNQKQYE